MSRDYINLAVNGQLHQLRGELAFSPLSDVLRYVWGLTGTKVVCAEGDCGACTVMAARLPGPGPFEYRAINSCIATAFLLDGCEILTIESLQEKNQPCEIQASMMRNFGGQCGFCTPGFVMAIASMYETKTQVNAQNAKNFLTGNLCRCTGYSPILDAAMDVDPTQHRRLCDRYPESSLTEQLRQDLGQEVLLQWNEKEFYAPRTLDDATRYKSAHPDVRIFSGATDLGVQINKGRDPGARLMSLHLVQELYSLTHSKGWIHVGAKVTLGRFQQFLESHIPAFAEFLNIFASPQIKNSGTLVGNIANASPIADSAPALLALDAEVELQGKKGPRRVPLSNFYKAYKTLDIQSDEIITHIHIPIPQTPSKLRIYKISQRRDLDIACVNAGFFFELQGKTIKKARLAYGGVAATPLRLLNIERSLEGSELERSRIPQIAQQIAGSLSPLSDVRGSADYRKKLAGRLFEKFALEELL